MTEPRLRKPRFERCPDSPPVALTERDVRILALVDGHRFIQSHHLTALLAGSRQHLIRRLGRLYHAGYLERPRCQLLLRDCIATSFVYCLTRKGQRVLQQHSALTYAAIPQFKSAGSALSLCHALRVTDIVAALEAAARSVHFISHYEWPHDSSLRDRMMPSQLRWSVFMADEGDRLRTIVIPDAAFALQPPGSQASYFLLEVDRGTMPVTRRNFLQSSFLRKILAYKETRRAGVLWQRFQIPGFRVLIVADSARRLASLQAATAGCFQRGESGMFLFAVAHEFLSTSDALNHVWQTCSGKEVRLLSAPPPSSSSGSGLTGNFST